MKLRLKDLFNVPCLLSLARIPLGITMLIMRYHYGLSPLATLPVGVIGGATDYFDGWYARRYDQKSRMGEYIDPICDKFLLACAVLVVLDQIEVGIKWATLISETAFVIIPTVGLFFTTESVASMWPGKVRVNLQLWGLIFIYLDYSHFGNHLLFSAIPFAVVTAAMGLKKIVDMINKRHKDEPAAHQL